VINVINLAHFDPYPFILLNLAFSLFALPASCCSNQSLTDEPDTAKLPSAIPTWVRRLVRHPYKDRKLEKRPDLESQSLGCGHSAWIDETVAACRIEPFSTSGAPTCSSAAIRATRLVDRSGHAEKLSLPARSYLHPRISPDTRKLAVEIEGANHDCYVYDFGSGVLSNITTDGVSHWPLWSPDGKTIGYRSGAMGHYQLWQVQPIGAMLQHK
jgi:hypothetical protein